MVQNSPIFTGFFLNAQLETQSAPGEPASIDVFLMNGHKITVDITSTGSFVYIFGLPAFFVRVLW